MGPLRPVRVVEGLDLVTSIDSVSEIIAAVAVEAAQSLLGAAERITTGGR